MSLICSDYSAVLILEQVSYLLDHVFCPWYMIFDFIPFSQYLDEVGGFYLGILYGPDRIHSTLDLLAALARLPRAIFYSVYINIVFFNFVYKVIGWVTMITYKLMCFALYLIFDFPYDVLRVWYYLEDEFLRFVVRTLND